MPSATSFSSYWIQVRWRNMARFFFSASNYRCTSASARIDLNMRHLFSHTASSSCEAPSQRMDAAQRGDLETSSPSESAIPTFVWKCLDLCATSVLHNYWDYAQACESVWVYMCIWMKAAHSVMSVYCHCPLSLSACASTEGVWRTVLVALMRRGRGITHDRLFCNLRHEQTSWPEHR